MNTLQSPAILADYIFLPATIADIEGLLDVNVSAFDQPWRRPFLPNVEPSEQRARLAKRHRAAMENPHLTGAHYIKCVEKSTGAIVAFAKWEYPVKLTDAQKAEKSALDERLGAAPPPKGANVELLKEHGRQAAAAKRKWRNTETDYFLQILGTLHAHRRRGIGTQLLADGLKIVDSNGGKTYLETSDDGLRLYTRQGFEIVDKIEIDLQNYGVEEGGFFVGPCLVRQAKEPSRE